LFLTRFRVLYSNLIRTNARTREAWRVVLTQEQPTDMTAAVLFDSLWENLADLLGTAATATLIRRAIKRAEVGHTEFPTLINSNNTYEYKVPDSWGDPSRSESLDAFRVLARELGLLLVQLTGPVVVLRLERHPPFQKHGIRFAEAGGSDHEQRHSTAAGTFGHRDSSAG
jgi:hypothetical protein